MSTPLGDRIDHAIDLMGGMSRAVSKTGLAKSMLSRYRDGESEPSILRAAKIAESAKIDLRWLAYGVGEPTLQPAGFVTIPRYDVRLAAGDGAISDRAPYIDEIPFTSDFLRKRLGRTNPNGLMIFEASGDSMEPTIADGDLVMVDCQDNWMRDGLFAFTFGDEARVKRLHRLVGGIEVRSDNLDLYPAEILKGEQADQLQIIGRVVWAGRTF